MTQPSADAPLAGMKVVALEHAVAAPLCSRHLADLGADVVKVEHPSGGDFARRYDSIVEGLSAYFVWLNYGKRSVALNLKVEADRAVIRALLGEADVFVHNLGPGAAERLGLGYADLAADLPRLVVCSISGFGTGGPYTAHKAFDLILQGEAGLISVTGSPDEPAKVGISVADISAGMYAVSAILAALLARERTGVGRHVEVAMLDCLAEWMSVPIAYERYGPGAPHRTGSHHATIAPYGPFTSGEGDVVLLAVQTDGQWNRLCASVLRSPELAEEARFATNEARVENREALHEEIGSRLRGRTRDQLVMDLAAADIPYGEMNNVRAVIDHPQLAARGRWRPVRSEAGQLLVVTSPLGRGLDAAPAVPRLDEDGPAIRRRLAPGDRDGRGRHDAELA